MDFLNKAFAQLSELFRSMTPGARITAGLLLVVIVVSLAYLFNSQFTGPDDYLLGGQTFTAAELTAMQGAFGQAQLNDFKIEGGRVRIPSAKQDVYLAALADSGALPTNYGDALVAAAEKPSLWAPRSQQEEMARASKKRMLSLLLSKMNGVESASVDFDVQQTTGLKRSRTTTALVAVKLRGNQFLDDDRVGDFQRAVTGAIAGLVPTDVTVIDENSGKSYGGRSAGGAGSASEDPYLSRVRKYQREYEASVLEALSYVPGVAVAAQVELTRELREVERAVKVDPKTIPIMTSEQSDVSTNDAPGPQGRPGLAGQGGVPNQPVTINSSSQGTRSNTQSRKTEEQNVASHGTTEREFAGLTPKRVSLAISVPTSWFESVWRQRNPTPAGEEPKQPDAAALAQIQTEETAKIRSVASKLIPPPPEGVDPTTLVEVVSFTNIVPAADTGPSLASQALAWLSGSWSTVGMIGLALMSLLMLRSMIRSAPTFNEPAVAGAVRSTAEETAAEARPESQDAPKTRFRRKLSSGPSMRDELVEMVREDPDAAANILRGWIGNVG